MTEDSHRAMRELLGALVLGHLDQTETARVRAHVDGCSECRAEYDSLAPLALALRDVDPDSLEEWLEPGALLGVRIEAEIKTERTRRNRRSTVQRALIGTAASLILVLTFRQQIEPSQGLDQLRTLVTHIPDLLAHGVPVKIADRPAAFLRDLRKA